jgi:hypothetical protein
MADAPRRRGASRKEEVVLDRGVIPLEALVAQEPDPQSEAGRQCSSATAKALRAVDLVAINKGQIDVPLALHLTRANLRYYYLAVSLTRAERDLVEGGLYSLIGIQQRRRETSLPSLSN